MQSIIDQIQLLNLVLAIMAGIGIYGTIDGFARLGMLGRGEQSRKAIHISIGLLAASLPVFMNRSEIFVFHSLFFIGLVGLSVLSHVVKRSKKFRRSRLARSMLIDIFNRYEDVKRWTIGQYLYPLALMLLVLFWDDLLIYSFSVLILALSDGFAALIGKTFGKTKYHFFGGEKSLVGSSTFFLVSVTIIGIFALHQGIDSPLIYEAAIVYALVLTVLEALISGGFDNIAVPLIAATLLNTL